MHPDHLFPFLFFLPPPPTRSLRTDSEKLGALHERFKQARRLLAGIQESSSAVENRPAWEELRGVLSDVVPVLEKELGMESEETLGCMANLAHACFQTKRYDKAVELEERVRPAFVRVYKENHPTTMQSMAMEVMYLLHLEDFKKALEAAKRLLAVQQEVLGEEHEATINTKKEVAKLLSLVEQHEEEEGAQADWRAGAGQSEKTPLTEEALALWDKSFMPVMSGASGGSDASTTFSFEGTVKREVLDMEEEVSFENTSGSHPFLSTAEITAETWS